MLGTIIVMAAGGTLILPSDGGVEATRHAITEWGANYLGTVPTVIRRLVDDPALRDILRTRAFSLMHGDASTPLPLIHEMLDAWPGCRPFNCHEPTEAPELTVLGPADYLYIGKTPGAWLPPPQPTRSRSQADELQVGMAPPHAQRPRAEASALDACSSLRAGISRTSHAPSAPGAAAPGGISLTIGARALCSKSSQSRSSKPSN